MLVERNFLTSQIYKQMHTNPYTQVTIYDTHTYTLTYYTHKTLTVVLIEQITYATV